MEESDETARLSDIRAANARSVVHFMKNPQLTHAQRDMLMTDYAARRRFLQLDERAELDDLAMRLHLPQGLTEERNSEVSGELMSASKKSSVDAGIVAILPVEFKAIRSVFGLGKSDFETGDDGTRYYRSAVDSEQVSRPLSIVATLAEGAYDLQASDAVHGLVQNYNPELLVLVGIAAGNEDEFSCGDVAVPRVVMNYEAERLQQAGPIPRPRYENRPKGMNINLNQYDPDATQFYAAVREYALRVDPLQMPEKFDVETFRPKVKTQNVAVAVGAKLIADGVTMDRLRERDQLVVIADQESWGFAHACRERWWAIFRGVSDYGDPEKGDRWQFMAASMAALCLKDFLETQYIPRSGRH